MGKRDFWQMLCRAEKLGPDGRRRRLQQIADKRAEIAPQITKLRGQEDALRAERLAIETVEKMEKANV
jgi:hypothetical protein